MPAWNAGSRVSSNLATHCCVERASKTTRPRSNCKKNGSPTAVCYHTPCTTASRFWARTNFHLAAYTWHWRIDIIFVWKRHGNMSPLTGIRVNTNHKRIASCAEYQVGAQSQVTPPPIAVSSVLTTQPPPIRIRWIGTSRMVSHIRHNSEPNLGGYDSPLDCLHFALACKYHFCMEVMKTCLRALASE